MNLALDDSAIVARLAATSAPIVCLISVANSLVFAANDYDGGLQLRSLDFFTPPLDHSCAIVNDKLLGHFSRALTPKLSGRAGRSA